MRRLILLVAVALTCAGCLSQQVAQKARTADDQAGVVLAQVKALAEFDAAGEQEAQRLRGDVSNALNALDSAIRSNNMLAVVAAWEALAAVEQAAAAAVEQAKARARAAREVREQADRLKANTAETATVADANAAQVSMLTGVIGAGLGLPSAPPPPAVRNPPPPPGHDYTPEIVTVITALLTAGGGVQIGKKIMARRSTPAPLADTPAPLVDTPRAAVDSAADPTSHYPPSERER